MNTNHHKDFKLATIGGRGFAMGHRHSTGMGGVSVSFTLPGAGFSLDPISVEDARALAAAITEAADYAETGLAPTEEAGRGQ
jgi:hypothetical protein